MYGIAAREDLGTVLRGSYNTFLTQTSRLVLVNPSATSQSLSLSLVRSTGDVLATNVAQTIPANGYLEVDLNTFAQADTYGVVTVQVPTNTILGWVLRERSTDYVIPTPVRE